MKLMAIILNNDVFYLYRMWQKTSPGYCKCSTHFDDKGDPLSDDKVCLRERAWRKYVVARDKALLGIAPKDGKKPNLGDLFQAFEED